MQHEPNRCIQDLLVRLQKKSWAASDSLLLRLDDVCTLLNVSPSTLKRMIKRGEFPPPIIISDRIRAWPRSQLVQYVERLTQEAGPGNDSS